MMTGDDLELQNRNDKNLDYLLMKCIEADLFDVALDIVGKMPEHATSGHATSGNALRILARKPEAFKRKRTRWEIYSSTRLGIFASILVRMHSHRPSDHQSNISSIRPQNVIAPEPNTLKDHEKFFGHKSSTEGHQKTTP
ncbi:hypothetical protein L6452_15559 [Arctium lappa]|uniref:Uncharacterized protein n=1 Tax=Arctium lappa TaxID=4217 RepID=A0ACB9CNX6_ARCLA|nr:hypothetical protein L6452_15559 [Arctium lappa]